jgi:NADH dehydrogenase (ubiquinone) 1 alpha subcomplex subunit 7
MASSKVTREISPALQLLREFLTGRRTTNPLRFQQALAPRPGPGANLPEGPAHKVAANYYYARDARREVHPPTVVVDKAAPRALPAGGGDAAAAAVATSGGVARAKTPGKFYNYSQ